MKTFISCRAAAATSELHRSKQKREIGRFTGRIRVEQAAPSAIGLKAAMGGWLVGSSEQPAMRKSSSRQQAALEWRLPRACGH